MESDSSRDSLEGAINEEKIYAPPSDKLPSLPFALVPFVQSWSHLHQPNKPEPDSFYDMYSRTLVIQKGLFFYIFKSRQIEPTNYPTCMQIQMGKPVQYELHSQIQCSRSLSCPYLQNTCTPDIQSTQTSNRVTETRLEQSPSKREILGVTFINHIQANLLVITRIGFDLFFYKEDKCEIIPIKNFSMPNTQLYWYELQTNTILLNCTMAKDAVIPFFLNQDPEKFKNVKGDRIILGEVKEESTIYKAFRFFQKTESSMITPIPLRQPIYNRNLKFAKDEVEDDFRRAMSRLAPFPHQLVLTTIYLDIVILYYDPECERVFVYRLDVDKNQRERYSIKVQKNSIISLQVSQNLIIIHNVTKKYSQFYDINGEKLNKSITCRGKIVSDGYGVITNFHPYTPRLLFLENDIVLDPQFKNAYWYIFNVNTLIELCKSPVELLFLLIRRTNLKEYIIHTILKTIEEQISLGKISKVFAKISQIYRKATIERNMRKKLQQQGGSSIQVEKPVNRLSTFQSTPRLSSIRISSDTTVESLSEENKSDTRFSLRGREEVQKKVKKNSQQVGLTNSGEIIIYLTEMNSEIFQKIVWSELPTDYVLACLLESQRSVLSNQIPSVPAHQTLLIKFLVRRREYQTLVKLIQLKIIKDTASLAQLLKELGAPRRLKTGIEQNDPLGFFHGAFQLGIDIYHRLRRYDKIYEAFLQNCMIYDAIDYAERIKELTGLPFRGLIEIAKTLTSVPLRRRVGKRLASLKKVRKVQNQRHQGKDYKFLFEGGDEKELRGVLQSA